MSTSAKVAAKHLAKLTDLTELSSNIVTVKLIIATWNLLADGLAIDEFLNGGNTGDYGSTYWEPTLNDQVGRGMRIVKCMAEAFKKGTTILNTQENDHADWILKELQKVIPKINMVKLSKYSESGVSNAHRFLMKRLETSTQEIKNLYETEYGIDDDCLAVYYDSSKVEVLEFNQFTIYEKKGVKTLCGIVKFKTINGDVIFNDVNVHLKSGENSGDAKKRKEETLALLKGINKYCPDERVIIGMDSNSSDMYRSADDTQNLDEVKKLLIESDFIETILVFCENIKMRHGSGNQPKKFGWFFMDLIDKIFYCGRGIKCEQVHIKLETFMTYDQLLDKDDIESLRTIRTDPSIRESLHELVKREQWAGQVSVSKNGDTLDDNDIFPQELQRALYPRGGSKPAPSDHPICFAMMTLTKQQDCGGALATTE